MPTDFCSFGHKRTRGHYLGCSYFDSCDSLIHTHTPNLDSGMREGRMERATLHPSPSGHATPNTQRTKTTHESRRLSRLVLLVRIVRLILMMMMHSSTHPSIYTYIRTYVHTYIRHLLRTNSTVGTLQEPREFYCIHRNTCKGKTQVHRMDTTLRELGAREVVIHLL